jgi:Oxidoreductase family, NAD-binding Rossmann fold
MTRIAVIGNGKWAKTIIRTLEVLPDLAAVVCGRGEASPPNIDGVVIATPSATHAEVALPYIQRGIPTFIEKPMATSLPDAKRLLQAAEKSLAPVLVGHLQLYNVAFNKFLTLLPEIGKLRLVVLESMGGEDRKDCSVFGIGFHTIFRWRFASSARHRLKYKHERSEPGMILCRL